MDECLTQSIACVSSLAGPGWFVNMFEIESNDPETGSVEFSTWTDADGLEHPVGGWQGGRGWQIKNASHIDDPMATDYLVASKWMIENVIEALDAPNEWFFDEAAGKLLLIPNSTDPDMLVAGGPPPSDEKYVAVVLETLISINGTKAAPVKDITVQGITFRDAADITMEPWAVPSGGDWGLYRGGAIFIEGAEEITIQHNTFTRLDGNGVFVSGYTRMSISRTQNSNGLAATRWRLGIYDENDGMDGQQPRYTYGRATTCMSGDTTKTVVNVVQQQSLPGSCGQQHRLQRTSSWHQLQR